MNTGEGPAVVRRPHWGRRIMALLVVALLVSRWWAPPLLRRMAFFRVRHVEVRGAALTPPSELVQRLHIDTLFSIWNDLDSLEARVASHPQVRVARITRRLPSTLVITVQEYQPVALVGTVDGFRGYDATGRALPLDPSRTPVDVPIAASRDSTIFRFLGELRSQAPDIFARVSEVRHPSPDELQLRFAGFPVRVRPDIAIDRLAQVFLVERDLAARHARVAEIDFRFRDQVIARLQ